MAKKKEMSLADIAAAFNIEPSKLIAPEVKEEIDEWEAQTEARSLEAETVICYIQNSDREKIFLKRKCALCNSTFLSAYKNVAYCSDKCRKDYLESKGLIWDHEGRTKGTRWSVPVPKVIGPEATKILLGMEFPDATETPSPVIEEDGDDFDLDAFIAGEG